MTSSFKVDSSTSFCKEALSILEPYSCHFLGDLGQTGKALIQHTNTAMGTLSTLPVLIVLNSSQITGLRCVPATSEASLPTRVHCWAKLCDFIWQRWEYSSQQPCKGSPSSSLPRWDLWEVINSCSKGGDVSILHCSSCHKVCPNIGSHLFFVGLTLCLPPEVL